VSERSDLSRWCYACGDLNPIGLHLHFRVDSDWAVASFVATREHQGYPGFVHGGVVAALLDEAMGWATYGRDIWAVTGKMEMRFRGIVPIETPLEVRGRIVRDRGRSLELLAELRGPDGALLAEAEGLFFRVQGERARLIADSARALQERQRQDRY
jgi:acyl-coenzyme A thioesterase PaaI-like protein